MSAARIDGKELLYQDGQVLIVHTATATKGHIQIYPKKDVVSVDELDEGNVQHMMFCANYCSAVLFELLGAHGTNIVLTEGDGLHLDVFERIQDDGIDLQWKPKTIDQGEMTSIGSQIKDKILIGVDEPVSEVKVKEKPPEEITVPEEENYLLKQLDKIP
ncbi:MAG: HIT domain-containing protein [Nanoarchaeota archaeon]|nr:HIT domain-containing protein [Nanoarchaeota archaeon]